MERRFVHCINRTVLHFADINIVYLCILHQVQAEPFVEGKWKRAVLCDVNGHRVVFHRACIVHCKARTVCVQCAMPSERSGISYVLCTVIYESEQNIPYFYHRESLCSPAVLCITAYATVDNIRSD